MHVLGNDLQFTTPYSLQTITIEEALTAVGYSPPESLNFYNKVGKEQTCYQHRNVENSNSTTCANMSLKTTSSNTKNTAQNECSTDNRGISNLYLNNKNGTQANEVLKKNSHASSNVDIFNKQLAKHQAMLKLQHEKALQHFNEALRQEVEGNQAAIDWLKEAAVLTDKSNGNSKVQQAHIDELFNKEILPNANARKACVESNNNTADDSFILHQFAHENMFPNKQPVNKQASSTINFPSGFYQPSPFETLGTVIHIGTSDSLEANCHAKPNANINEDAVLQSNVAIVQPQSHDNRTTNKVCFRVNPASSAKNIQPVNYEDCASEINIYDTLSAKRHTTEVHHGESVHQATLLEINETFDKLAMLQPTAQHHSFQLCLPNDSLRNGIQSNNFTNECLEKSNIIAHGCEKNEHVSKTVVSAHMPSMLTSPVLPSSPAVGCQINFTTTSHPSVKQLVDKTSNGLMLQNNSELNQNEDKKTINADDSLHTIAVNTHVPKKKSAKSILKVSHRVVELVIQLVSKKTHNM